jgi:uncharacterized protein (TIGR02271 family)
MNNSFGFFGDEDRNQGVGNTVDSKNIVLHKEELDISKDTVQTGEVILNKEVIEEQKTVNVPVMHEEIVIERRALNNQTTSSSISDDETIRVPVNEEKVQVGKHTVATEEITLYKKQVEDTKEINETLQREDISIDSTGDANIINTSDTTTTSGGDPNLGGNQGIWSDIEQTRNVDTSGQQNYGGHQVLP